MELGDNPPHGMALTVTWGPEGEERARAAVATALQTLDWTAWLITDFHGEQRWPELHRPDAKPGLESTLANLANRLRILARLREIGAPASFIASQTDKIRDLAAEADGLGWTAAADTLPAGLYDVLVSLATH
jgi:hypothetical protein